MKPRLSILFGSVALLALAVGGGWLLRPRQQPTVPIASCPLTVRCLQPGAVLWVDGIPVESLPCTVDIPTGGMRLRVTSSRFPAWDVRLNRERAASLGGELLVDLGQSDGLASLAVTSTPSGAEVRLDGKARGRTPLLLEGLRPGPQVLALSRAGCAVVEQEIDLQPGPVPRPVHVDLPDALVDYYESMVRQNPGNLDHHAELAHQLVLQNRYAEAVAAFEAGVGQIRLAPEADADRFWQEVQSTLSGQYWVTPSPETTAFRRQLARRLAEICSAAACDTPQVCVAHARLLRVLGNSDGAAEELRAIRLKFRNDPAIERLLPN